MNQLLFYLLQVIAASGLLYGYYHFALRNKRFHRYNRFYLLMAVVISSLIPFLNIPVYFSENEAGSSVVLQTLQVISSPAVDESASTVLITEATRSSWFTAERLLYFFYFLVLFFFIVRVFISLNKIRFIIKRNSAEQIDKIKFINTDEPGTPFSFFRWLFWNRKIELHSEKGEQIFRHELFHIQQKHSWDIIFMELISPIFWINPFFHLMKKELKAIHEFLADEFAIKENKNWQYAELLLMQVLNTNNHLVNPFFHNQIKRRIAMITTSTKPSYQYLRKLMVFPVAAIIVFLFAFNYKNKRIDPHEFEKAINSITVVIDAGHGGSDKGARSRDGKYYEAQLSLEIAKKIQLLAHDYNINVIMTREDEGFPGGAVNINEGLRKRVELVNNTKPDAFIAIHLNSDPTNSGSEGSGIDAYVTKQRYNAPDIMLATIVLNELKTIYTTRQEIKQREDAGIFIIDEAKYPSMLLECGFINNPKDLAFIKDKKNQGEIAKAILKALVTFANRQQKDDLGFIFLLNKNEGDTSKPKELKEYENYLVIINGIVQSKRGFKAIDSSVLFAKDGVKITVYKDSTGIKKYGQKGKDGVIEITLGNDARNNKPKPDTLIWIKQSPSSVKRSPTAAELKKWEDSKAYGVWIDANRISNVDLRKYKPSDFEWYDVSKLTKTAINYGKHDFQVSLYTKKYYEGKSLTATKFAINDNINNTVKEITLIGKASPFSSDPLLVINGKPLPGLKIDSLDNMLSPSDIESMNMLAPDTAIKKYGYNGKNGAIEIKAKKIKEIEIWQNKPVVDDDNKVFVKVEVEASFPGGAPAWRKFLTENLNPVVPVDSGANEGTYTVVLQFIADKEGNVSNITALTKHGFGMEQECIRVMKLSPKWNPAMQNGIPVKAYRKQPFTFVITGDPDSDPITEKEMSQLATVYPNPTDNNATILFNSNVIEKGEVRVYDVMSNLKLVSKVNFVKGGNKVILNVSSLGAGTYIITINGTNGKATKTLKLIKK